MHLLMCNRFNPHEGYTTVALPHHTRPNSTAPIDATPYRATKPYLAAPDPTRPYHTVQYRTEPRYYALPHLCGTGLATPLQASTRPDLTLPCRATMPYLAKPSQTSPHQTEPHPATPCRARLRSYVSLLVPDRTLPNE